MNRYKKEFFDQKFLMFVELKNGIEIDISFTAYFQSVLTGFEYETWQDIYGCFCATHIEFDHKANEKYEKYALQYANENMIVPEFDESDSDRKFYI